MSATVWSKKMQYYLRQKHVMCNVTGAGTNGFTQERVSILFHVPSAGQLSPLIPNLRKEIQASKMESLPVSITTVSNDSFLKPVAIRDRNEVQNNKPIIITRCLSQKCIGFYTDSLSESILVRCLDPKHNIKNEAGNQPTPTYQQSRTTPFSKRLENENR